MTSPSSPPRTEPEREEAPAVLPAAPTPDQQGQALSVVARHPLGSAVLALVALSCLLRASALSSSWFGGDDFVYFARAHRLGLSWQLLHVNYSGQYMPGGLVLVALNEAVSPLGWRLVVWENVALTALAGWTFWRLLRTVFTPNPRLLLPLALYLTSPLTLTASTWWSASLNTLPLLVVVPLALTSHVRLLRTGRQRHALAAAGWLALGLAFFVKAVLLVPLLVLLTLALRGTAGAPASWTAALWRCRVLGVAVLAVLAGYAALYGSAPRLGSTTGIQLPHSLGELLRLYELGLGSVVLPGLLGGPWRWIGIDGPTALSGVGTAARVLSGVLVLGGILALCLVRRRAWLVWTAAGLYVCGDLAFVAVGRLNQGDPVLALEPHYLADSLPVLWLALTFGFFRLAGETGETLRRRRLRLPAVASWRHRMTALAAGAGVLLSSVGSTLTLVHDRLSRDPARTFVETAREQLAAAPDDLRLYDRKVPPTVLTPLFNDDALASRVLAPITPVRLAASSRARYAEFPQAFDDTGRLRRVTVTGVRLTTGPDQGCGWRVAGTRRALPWSQPVGPALGALRIGYLSTGQVEATFRHGSTTLTARLHEGLGQLVFTARGPGNTLTVSVPAGGNVCIGDAQFGDVRFLP